MKKGNVLWGLLLIVAAVLLVANQFTIIDLGIGIFRLVMGILLIAACVSGIKNRSFFGIIFPIGLLWIVFDDVLDLPRVSFMVVLLACLLLSMGFSALFPRFETSSHADDRWNPYEDENMKGEHQTVVDEDRDNNIYFCNRFGAARKDVVTQHFAGGNLVNSFGEMKVFFDHAVIDTEQVDVQVSNNFGSMQLFIPKEWNVKNEINLVASSVDEKNRSMTTGTPCLRLYGNSNFGEVGITYI